MRSISLNNVLPTYLLYLIYRNSPARHSILHTNRTKVSRIFPTSKRPKQSWFNRVTTTICWCHQALFKRTNISIYVQYKTILHCPYTRIVLNLNTMKYLPSLKPGHLHRLWYSIFSLCVQNKRLRSVYVWLMFQLKICITRCITWRSPNYFLWSIYSPNLNQCPNLSIYNRPPLYNITPLHLIRTTTFATIPNMIYYQSCRNKPYPLRLSWRWIRTSVRI